MDRLGVGVIGLGVFGERHARIYASMPEVRLVAVCSRSADRGQEVAGRLGFLRHYMDMTDLLADPEVDAVSITTEPVRHAEMALTALQAGKHVLLEKPIATNLADAGRLVQAAQGAPGQLMIGHTLRFDMRYAALKEQVASGRLGHICSIYARRNGLRSLFQRKPLLQPMLDSGIHDIDLMHWMIEDDVQRVYGLHNNNLEAHRPDTCWGMMRFQGGAIGVIESSMIMPDYAAVSFDASMEIIGDKGVAHLRVPEQGVAFWLEDRTSAPDLGTWAALRDQPVGALCEELRYFVTNARTGIRVAHGTPDQALQALRVALAIIESADKGGEIFLES